MIKLNVDAKAQTIESEFQRGIAAIKANAEKGQAQTDLVFPRECYDEVRCRINEYCKENKVDGFWLTLSGPMGSMSSIACGDGRLMKFKLRS